MKYAHVVEYVASTPWAILPRTMSEILSVLAFRAAGHSFTAEEIRARIGDRPAGASRSLSRGVAVVPIRGVIAHRMNAMADTSGGTSCEQISGMLRQVMADKSIDTVILDVDSPGGTVAGVSELAAEIFAARGAKRIVAVCNALCASAGYWLASQAHAIVAIPSATVGSIGVFAVHESLERALEKAGIKITLVQFGKWKTEGNPFQDLTEDGLAQLQGRVNQTGEQFVRDVARGRGVSPAFVRSQYGDGRTFSALDAKAAGLIDRLGTLSDTVARSGSATAAQLELEARVLELQLVSLPPAAPLTAPRSRGFDEQRLELELALLDL